jgi:hypothetical protein
MTCHSFLEQASRRWLAPALASVLMGCASTTPQYDARFGEAVRHNLQAQTLAPAAGQDGPAAAALDASSARAAVQRYRDSFKAPPPVVNVINLGTGSGP